MSYPAILPTLPAFAPAARRGPHPALPAYPSQLLDWLRLAARQVFGKELAERFEPYRACSRCVSQVRWCGEGVPTGLQPTTDSHSPLGPLTPLTPLTPSLILGAKADPYSLAEAVERRTRGLLEGLAQLEGLAPNAAGLEISILTRSPLLLRDLDLLAALDQRHAVTVGVLIPAADPRLARRLERPAPAHPARREDPAHPAHPPNDAHPPASPDERFEMVRTLAAHGIATEVVCTPIQPGLNNGVAVLRGLFDRAHQAGAFDVRPAPRHPAISPAPPTSAQSGQLLALFHRLRLERGFPRLLAGRG